MKSYRSETCPVCRARPGRPCVTTRGKRPGTVTGPHAPRLWRQRYGPVRTVQTSGQSDGLPTCCPNHAVGQFIGLLAARAADCWAAGNEHEAEA